MNLIQPDEQKPMVDNNSDHVYSNFTGDMNFIRQFVSQIALHDQTIIELQPDGRIIVTPSRRRLLANELLYLILDQVTDRQTLYECTLVSKDFYSHTNSLLYQNLDFANNTTFSRTNNNDIQKRFIAYVASASDQELSLIGQHARKLHLDHPHWKNTHLDRLLPFLSQLTHLTISPTTRITGTSLQHVPFHCQQLTFLRLHRADELTKDLFLGLGQYCHYLETFEWVVNKNESTDWLQHLLPLSHCLKSLEFKCFLAHVNETAITTIKQLDHLTHLNVDTMNVDAIQQLVTPTSSAGTSTVLYPHLTSLQLNFCTFVNDNLLIDFIKTHPQLQVLHLHCAISLTNQSLLAMATGLCQLKSLEIFEGRHVSGEGIRQLVRGCLHLDRLALFACDLVSTLEFQHVALPSDDSQGRTIVLDRQGMDKLRLEMV